MLKLRVCVIALLACVFFAAGCSRKEEQPMTTALKYVMDGEWAKADRPSAEAIMKTPDNINALILRSLVCERLKRYDEAVENAYKAVTIDSNSFAAVYTLGRLYSADTRRRSDAIELLIKANRLRSDHPLPLVLLCNLHQPGQKSSYLAALSRLPGWSNAPEVEFESCMNRVYNRDRRGVEAAYIRLFNSHPDHPELTSALGGYFYFCRRYDMAKAAFKRYLAFPEKQRTALRSARAQKRLASIR
jgi:tetratricopeptide (TPR) repeat protein